MKLILNAIRVAVENDELKDCLKFASRKLGLCEDCVRIDKILSKSLDARNKKQFYFEMSVIVDVPDDYQNKDNFSLYIEEPEPPKKICKLNERPIIIGFGPAGMFASLELIEAGIKPIIFERGKDLDSRAKDINKFINERILNTESNIQFGEGGAGAYSDGKLFSRIKNSASANKVLNTFIKFGAPEEIGYISKPHLGTDVLCSIVKKIRNYIIDRGGEINFDSKMTDLIVKDDSVKGVVINGEKEFFSNRVYLALGHSARDTFENLYNKGIVFERKPTAIGLRIEHSSETINLIRYGNKYKNFKKIGTASYSFTHTNKKIGRGAYTFCMCPGGEIVNAASENEHLVLNGMSYSKRASPFSNSAIVVTCKTEDFGEGGPLKGIEFQRDIEHKAYLATNGTWKAPAQNLSDFLENKDSVKINSNSFKMGVLPANLKDIFPSFINDMLIEAFKKWKREYPLFISNEAVLLGVETRTSCPIRILRNEKFESVNLKGLYPIGEGAGYAGGITSSAIDAINSVKSSLQEI